MLAKRRRGKLKTLGNIGGGQPGTTWDNLFFEVVPPLYVDFTALMKRWDGWDNLFVSLACEGKKNSTAYLLYGRSWQKVVPSVPRRCKSLIISAKKGDNLKTEVVPGCPPTGLLRAV